MQIVRIGLIVLLPRERNLHWRMLGGEQNETVQKTLVRA